jgi:hypothetical protein
MAASQPLLIGFHSGYIPFYSSGFIIADLSEDTEVPSSPKRVYWFKASGFRPEVL